MSVIRWGAFFLAGASIWGASVTPNGAVTFLLAVAAGVCFVVVCWTCGAFASTTVWVRMHLRALRAARVEFHEAAAADWEREVRNHGALFSAAENARGLRAARRHLLAARGRR